MKPKTHTLTEDIVEVVKQHGLPMDSNEIIKKLTAPRQAPPTAGVIRWAIGLLVNLGYLTKNSPPGEIPTYSVSKGALA